MKSRYVEEILVDIEIDPLEVLASEGQEPEQVAWEILNNEVNAAYLVDGLIDWCKQTITMQVANIVRDEITPKDLRNIGYWVRKTDISKCKSIKEIAEMFKTNPKV